MATSLLDRPPTFPLRAFIQQFDGTFPPDYLVVVEELKARGVPVYAAASPPRDLTCNDLVVGDFSWTRSALKQLGVLFPTPPDYPTCLKNLLHRQVWNSTLGEVRTLIDGDVAGRPAQVFIKPSMDTKAFSAIIEPKDQMLGALLDGIPGVLNPLPASLPVFCAEVVVLEAEFRVYVVHGKVRAICQYIGPPGAESALDHAVIEAAVRTLCDSDEGRDLTGCALDFALMRKPPSEEPELGPVTCLVEVNDGYSLGRYEGLSGRDYTDLLAARWQRLVTTPRQPAAMPIAIAFPQRFTEARGGPAFGSRNIAASVILEAERGGPKLLLGSFADACDIAALSQHGVRTVVNCTSECTLSADVIASLSNVVVLGLLDVETANLAGALPRALSAVEAGLASGHSVLVHCAQGVSRSAAVVLAFLVRHRGMSLAAAWQHVSARRDVSPNIGFWGQLLAFELSERGALSITPTQLRGHDTWAFVFDSEADAAAYFRSRGLPAP